MAKRQSALLATEHPIAAAPGEAEPVPVLNPAVAVPTDESNALGIVGMTPVWEDENDLAPKSFRDFLLVIQEILAVVLAQIGLHFLGALDHHGTGYRFLVSSQEAENLIGAVANGHGGAHPSLDTLANNSQQVDLEGIPLLADYELNRFARKFRGVLAQSCSKQFLHFTDLALGNGLGRG
ncbi:MAG: hypothetical protein CMI53_04260 [Parcubacteria group bacterium]|nr:hypothetical protein [Parcubacteria group bacterium]